MAKPPRERVSFQLRPRRNQRRRSSWHWGDPFATFVGNVNGSEVALTDKKTFEAIYAIYDHMAVILT